MSYIQSSGGASAKTNTNKSATGAISKAEALGGFITVTGAAAPVVLTLPPIDADLLGFELIVQKDPAETFPVSIIPSGVETIRGSVNPFILPGGGDSFSMIPFGTNWKVVLQASGYIPQQPDVSDSPVALYDFNGDMLDSSGNGYHLQVAGGLERYTDGHIPGTKGFAFMATWLTLANPAHDAFMPKAGDVTVLVSIRPRTVTVGMGVVGVFSGGAGGSPTGAAWGFQQGEGADLEQYYTWDSTLYPAFTFGDTGPKFTTPGIYRRVGIRRSANIWSAWMSGVKYADHPTPSTVSGAANSILTVGAQFGGVVPYQGDMASLAIYGTALSDEAMSNDAKRIMGF